MRLVRMFCIFVVGFMIYGRVEAYEDERAIRDEIRMLKERISRLEERLAGYERAEPKAESTEQGGGGVLEGLNIAGGITTVYQATYNANGNTSAREDSNTFVYSADLEFEKELSKRARMFLHLETGDGAGVDEHLAVFSPVNSDADDADSNVSVSEAWYEYSFDGVPLVFTVGKLDPTGYIDNNNYADDECTQFLGGIFRNSPVIEFPDNSLGVHIGISPLEYMSADFVVLNTDSDNDDSLSRVFVAFQLTFKPRLFKREGNYRLIGWMNGDDHTRWKNPLDTKKKSYGVTCSFDQRLTSNTGVFVRYGWRNPEVYLNGEDFSLEHSFSLGIQTSGKVWGREDDVFALAFGQVIPSPDYKKASARSANSEKHIEVYYNFKVNDTFHLTPDIQIIWNPYGNDAVAGDDTIVVGGLRMQADF